MAQWDYKVVRTLRGFGGMESVLKTQGAFGWELVSAHWGAWMLSSYMKRVVTIPAGWYLDPQTAAGTRQRYHDGETWTEHTAPASQHDADRDQDKPNVIL